MIYRIRRLGTLTAIVGFEAVAIVLLHDLGRREWMTVPWDRLQGWLETAPLEDVVAAGLRTVALGIAYWIAATTALCALARLSRIRTLVGWAARATLPPLRRVVDRSVVLAVTTAVLSSSPAIAGEAPPPEPIVYQISDQGIPTPVDPSPPAAHSGILPPGVGGAGYTPRPAGIADTPPADAPSNPGTAADEAATVHVVVSGDNLWTIAAEHLRRGDDTAVAKATIASYWRRVIELNTPHLRSGDPDLIFPGEQIVLPDAAGDGTS